MGQAILAKPAPSCIRMSMSMLRMYEYNAVLSVQCNSLSERDSMYMYNAVLSVSARLRCARHNFQSRFFTVSNSVSKIDMYDTNFHVHEAKCVMHQVQYLFLRPYFDLLRQFST